MEELPFSNHFIIRHHDWRRHRGDIWRKGKGSGSPGRYFSESDVYDCGSNGFCFHIQRSGEHGEHETAGEDTEQSGDGICDYRCHRRCPGAGGGECISAGRRHQYPFCRR